MAPTLEEREPFIEYMLNILKLTYGTGLPFDEEFHRTLAARSYDRSFCPEGTGRQSLAKMVQKDRTTELRELKAPSLIIHGDEDPLIPMSGGEATAAAISDSEFMIVKGMGHVMPIQIAGERILVPEDAVFNIEHERGKTIEEVEFQFKWKLS